MKEITIIYLLIITLSIANNYDFGKEITFDMNNNNTFEFTFDQDGSLFIQVDFPQNNVLKIHIVSPGLQFYFRVSELYSPIIPPGYTNVIPFLKGATIKIELIYKSFSNEKGVIWINPSINEIKIDLRKKYEWKHDYKEILYFIRHLSLTYSIDKAKRNAVLEFNYNNNLRIYDNDTIVAGNPLKIIHGSD